MSRSGYSDDCDDNWQHICWRGAVASAIRGKRGQAFLAEMLQAFEALPEKKLIADDLERSGAVCAIGAVGRSRGLDMSGLDPEDYENVAAAFGIPRALAQELVWLNDEETSWFRTPETDEARFVRMRDKIASMVKRP